MIKRTKSKAGLPGTSNETNVMSCKYEQPNAIGNFANEHFMLKKQKIFGDFKPIEYICMLVSPKLKR